MAEESKGVTVATTDSAGRRTHPNAYHLEVKDGHLTVKTNDGTEAEVVAIYAPGNWRSARVDRG